MRDRHFLVLAVASLAAALVHAPPAGGTIRHVPLDYPTIQSGINACVPADTVLVDAGDYAEHIAFPNFDITVASRYLTTGDPGWIDLTRIHPTVAGAPIVSIVGGQSRTALLCGLTISGGVGMEGHGIYGFGTNATIAHNRITNNCADHDGGGIHVEFGAPLIEQNLIYGN
jgi:hypothetical protein